DLAHLLRDDEPVLLVRDDQRRREAGIAGDPACGFLQQAAVAGQRQELLRIQRARHRPQPRARTARQNDRMNHESLNHSPATARQLPLSAAYPTTNSQSRRKPGPTGPPTELL